MSKQDRQGVRTATDLEMKYHFGQAFSEMRQMLQTATTANTTANNAKETADSALATANNAMEAASNSQDSVEKLSENVDTGLAGKAPAGYGLGAGGKPIASGDDLNNYKVGGWYQFTSGVSNAPTNYGMLLVIPGTGYLNDTFQYVFSRYPTNNMAIRQLFEGTWGQWEWINPPMEVGVEYRTTERYMGKPVYVKAVSLGNLPNAAIKQVRYATPRPATNILNIRGCAMNESGKPQPLPLDYNGVLIELHANAEFVFLRSIADNSAWTAVAVVKYTLD